MPGPTWISFAPLPRSWGSIQHVRIALPIYVHWHASQWNCFNAASVLVFMASIDFMQTLLPLFLCITKFCILVSAVLCVWVPLRACMCACAGRRAWCEALYLGDGNFRKSSVPQCGGHLLKLISVPGRNMRERINLFILILEAVNISYNLHSNNYLASERKRNF